jgi:alpha-tubulin suppressor-like RCC1 family protein
MPISTKQLIDNINFRLVDDATSSSTSSVYIAQLSEAAREIKQTAVSVASEELLPLASDNIGRLIYVESLCDYKYSNGSEWIRDYDTSRVYYNTIWSWGCNNSGQLASNNATSRSSPGSVVGGFNDWITVSSNGSVNIAAGIRSDGTLWGWGSNNYSALDGGTNTVSRSSPILVVGGITNWQRVSIGNGFIAALRCDNTIWMWGKNSGGILGDGTTVNRSSPVSIVGGFTNWCQVVAGLQYTLALRTSGELWAWGCGQLGSLGDGNTINRSSPVSIVGGYTDWCKVSALYNSAAIRTNGELWTWGSSRCGMLGDGTTVSKSSPVSVVGGFSWNDVATGNHHMLAIKNDGTLWAWGCGGQGRLGTGNSSNQSSPVSVTCGFTDWCQINAHYHSAGIRTNGTLWTWGCNGQGRLGDGTTIDRTLGPVSVVGNYTDWVCVDATSASTFAMRFICNKGF